LEGFEGGIVKLRKIILEDELNINAELEEEMNGLVGNYFDEWKEALKDDSIKRKFKQFANTVSLLPPLSTPEKADSVSPPLRAGRKNLFWH
jgi:hypothetical protein